MEKITCPICDSKYDFDRVSVRNIRKVELEAGILVYGDWFCFKCKKWIEARDILEQEL